MEAAIDSALIQTPADPSEVIGNCPSGNCTFPDYETMGVCSRVHDISPTIVRNCHHENTGAETQCFTSVADLQTYPPWRKDNFTGDGKDMTLWVGTSGVLELDDQLDPNSLGVFYTIYLPDTQAYHSKSNVTTELVALKGSLDLCVISYQTTVTSGITKTVEKSRATDLTWQPLWKVTGNTDEAVISTISGGKEYWMTEETRYAFRQYLSDDVFHGHSQKGETVSPVVPVTGSTKAATTLARLLVNEKGGQDAVSKMLGNLATAMTNALRTTSDEKSSAPGEAMIPEVYIAVEFRWLIAPIASVILALLFLLMIILESAQWGIPSWRSSQIKPLLSLDPSAAKALSLPGASKRPEERAKELEMRLEQGADGQWKLCI